MVLQNATKTPSSLGSNLTAGVNVQKLELSDSEHWVKVTKDNRSFRVPREKIDHIIDDETLYKMADVPMPTALQKLDAQRAAALEHEQLMQRPPSQIPGVVNPGKRGPGRPPKSAA